MRSLRFCFQLPSIYTIGATFTFAQLPADGVEGWSLLKGPLVFSDSICQAMVQKEPKEKKIKLKDDCLRKNSGDGVV